MAKSASPIRLQAELMQVAESTAKRFHRSTAEQIEYWADLGRSVSSTLDPDVLLSVISGLAILKAEPVFSAPIEPESVFETLENDRKSGLLQNSVTSAKIRYQASVKYPSYLEQIDLNGNVMTGQFENGQFIIAIDLEFE
ncbi:MAG: hypothetical protein COB23_04225 [Methylophaga sp.]|nr:MAG: hypothetical protein COB23_04225 [Methylophaga sp.]